MGNKVAVVPGQETEVEVSTPDDKNVQKRTRSNFTLLKLVFVGELGNIWLVQESGTMKKYILKEMMKAEIVNKKKVRQTLDEFDFFKSLENPFLIRAQYCFQDFTYLYVVLEYMKGQDLSHYLSTHQFDEKSAKFLISNIFLALEYLHERNILHLGIHPKHILIDEDGYYKLIGFKSMSKAKNGFSENLLDLELITEYSAPEIILRKKPGFSADFYSIGLLLFELMIRKPAVPHKSNLKDLYTTLAEKQIQIKKSDLPEGWSLESADFINKLIQRKPNNRLGFNGIQELRKHPWMKDIPLQKINDKLMKAPFFPIQRKKNIKSCFRKEKKPKNFIPLSKGNGERRGSLQEYFENYYFFRS